MNKRPRSITVISWIFIAVGVISLIGGLLPPSDPVKAQRIAELEAQRPFQHALVHLVHAAAIVGGAFMLRGRNWARWLLVGWIAFHIVISAMHSTFQLIVHSMLFGVVLYFLFLPKASSYFRGARVDDSRAA